MYFKLGKRPSRYQFHCFSIVALDMLGMGPKAKQYHISAAILWYILNDWRKPWLWLSGQNAWALLLIPTRFCSPFIRSVRRMGRLIHKFGVDFIDDSNMNEFLHDDSIFSTYRDYCIGSGWQRDYRGDSLVSNSIM